jgi:hypothetical protein
MLRSIPYGVLAVAIVGQFAANLGAGVLGAFAVPCCDDPTPELPHWYAQIAQPVYFLVLLLPGFLCGYYVKSRPILVGALAAALAGFLWHWLGSHILAHLFPARAVSGIGHFENALSILSEPVFLVTLAVSSACYAAAAAGAASGGYLLRSRAP